MFLRRKQIELWVLGILITISLCSKRTRLSSVVFLFIFPTSQRLWKVLKSALRALTCGDWQMEIRSDISPSINLHNTPVVSVIMCQIFYSHSEDTLVFVIRDWKLSWSIRFVCFNYIRTGAIIKPSTQVFHMVLVFLVIETWDSDWTSTLHWHFTDCGYAVNSCNKNKYSILLHIYLMIILFHILCQLKIIALLFSKFNNLILFSKFNILKKSLHD